MPQILILGLGNPLMGDDGVGAAVVVDLQRRGLPEEVSAEVASDILYLPSVWNGESDVWLVDAVQKGCAPGAFHIFEHAQITGLHGTHGSAHHLSLPDGLRWLIHTYPELANVRFRLWGVEPKNLAPSTGLSREVASTAARAAQAILSSITASRTAGSRCPGS